MHISSVCKSMMHVYLHEDAVGAWSVSISLSKEYSTTVTISSDITRTWKKLRNFKIFNCRTQKDS